MGIFRQRVTVANPGTRQATQVECMVETGSTYLWLPEDLLQSLGVQPLLGRRLKLATGQVIERPAAEVLVTLNGETLTVISVFGESVTEPAPGLQRPPVGAYPLELLGLLAPPAQRGPVTLTPSISVSEEYNDNLFLNNQDRRWDLITGFSPTITLFVNRPSYQVNGGYSFTAELYERESRLNNALNRQSFFGTGLYRATPRLTLTASETYAVNRNTNLVASQGFATGRQASLSNTFGSGLTYQMTPGTSLSLGATYGLLRFKGAPTDGARTAGAGTAGAGTASDSDTYGVQSTVAHELT